jgi:D-alanyl-lipoteichoic acid acyltransferase DltB (MBOAT superfamily)
MLETQFHLIDGVVILLAAAVPIYFTIRLKNNLRKLTTILSIFILMHAVYCWLDFFGFDLLSDGVFEPLSAAVLVFFGISYYGIANQRKVSIKNMVVIWNPGTFLLLMSSVTVILLLAALSIFVWLAARSKDIRSFQFQISIFIIIWVLGQVAGILQGSGIIVLSPLQSDIGLEIHVASLVFLSIMLWVRFYYSERSGKRIIEDATLG